MTAVIGGALVTGTAEEISNLIKIYNARLTVAPGTTQLFVTSQGCHI